MGFLFLEDSSVGGEGLYGVIEAIKKNLLRSYQLEAVIAVGIGLRSRLTVQAWRASVVICGNSVLLLRLDLRFCS